MSNFINQITELTAQKINELLAPYGETIETSPAAAEVLNSFINELSLLESTQDNNKDINYDAYLVCKSFEGDMLFLKQLFS